jgi:hypothetical protein
MPGHPPYHWSVANEITISDGTEWECPVCGAHTYVAADELPPSTCGYCGNGPLRASADLHFAPGEPIRKTPRQ